MRILDRYILKHILSIFFSCIFIFLFLYIIIDILSHLEDILKQQVTFKLLWQYYLAYLPIMFVQMSPFACLLSTLYTFGKLNHNNEIIAMRSSGLNIYQVSKTAIIFGIIISIFVFLVNDRLLPQSAAFTQRIKEQMESGRVKLKEESIQNLCIYGLRNRLFFINKFIPAKNTMEGIVILEHDEQQNLIKKIVANKGVYEDNLWKFYQSITYNFDRNGQIIQEPIYFEEEIVAIPEKPADFMNQRQRTEFMNIATLEDYLWKLSRSGASTVIRNLKIDLYQRFTAPLSSIIIILLGIPFSFMMRRRSTGLSSIGISIMVGFLYYIVDAISIALGRGGLLMPIMAASLSHITALLYSIYLIRTLP
ncbi:MAG: LptF/LptG family permease [Candidatus Omnitrophica bacterium]|nr:LptF/LptG family permease [Candidatus Omnitrophota bacterium]